MKISPYRPRRFVPQTIDLTDTAQLAPIFESLKEKLDVARTAEQLEVWLDDYSEVCAALSESSAITYIRMTCQTDDPEREKAYLKIVEEIDPWLKPRQFELMQLVSTHPLLPKLPSYYNIFRRSVQTRVKLYREENVARETEEAKLCQQYQKISGAMTVQFEGKEQTLPAMAKIQEEADRTRRQTAWELTAQRRLQDRPALDEVYDKLLGLRVEIAKAADYPDYRAYTFANYERFDYTPQDCIDFQNAVEKHIVPLARALQKKRQAKLGLDKLRPWDLAVDPEQRPPLRPFATGDELQTKTQAIFNKLDPRLGQYFSLLREHEVVDLDNRKGKAPGGYQSTLAEARLPFIFMNAVGLQRDVETLVHEAGHAFHAIAARHERLHAYRGAPIEFCEVASMSMELITAPHWTEFYNTDDARRAHRDHLEGIIKFFPWMATVDAFQHWIYTHPKHTHAERDAYWLSLMNRFGGIEDWSGYEDIRASLWHRQLHIFEIPFYYVEYGIAQLGALQLWQLSRRNVKRSLDHYLSGLSLGGSLPLPELFHATGIEFDFSDRTIEPLMAGVQAALSEIST
ncbi:MAG: peptidase M3 [Verrucomicrobia bacterium Tous-C9LFEB]|nr:MAG: peptidase M3 [Verrucomicrobia bacterium Tous-C9LFEB]